MAESGWQSELDVARQLLPFVYHEQQVAGLCAVHSINSILQSRQVDEIVLMEIAAELDQQESEIMPEMAHNPSQNVSLSGQFSIQVIIAALNRFNLNVTPLNVAIMECEKDDSSFSYADQQGFICWYEGHWFALRSFGNMFWMNLDSMKEEPEPISTTYLESFIAQLQASKYSIFVVTGEFPSCEADFMLESMCFVQPTMSSDASAEKEEGRGGKRGTIELPIEPDRTIYDVDDVVDVDEDDEFDQDELRKAIEMSLREMRK